MSDTTRHMDRAMRSGGSASRSSRMDREFQRARHHSVLVRVLKFGLPAAGALIVAGGVFVTWVARSLPEDLSVSAASISDGRIVMQDPRLSGFDKNNRPYTMTAERAIQVIGGGIDLEKVVAKVTTGGAATADIVAARGHFDQTAQTLRLFDDIKVVTSDGMTIALDAADIDLKTGSLAGAGPVEIVSPTQTIKAGTMDVRDSGKGLSFGSRVKIILNPSAGAAPRPLDFSSNETR